MKSLLDYEPLTTEVFYKCWPILDYIEAHPNMSPLDREAIEATIMDALVYKGLIDPTKESLDLDHLQIVEDQNHYCYEETPNICGIPLWMKEEFRKKALRITAGIPISIFLAKPPSKIIRYCVYDPNTAVSSLAANPTFYEAYYDSPTRPGVRLTETRPFVEIEHNATPYLVDILTKRILKTSWFKENYNMETPYQESVSEFSPDRKAIYDEQVAPKVSLRELIPFIVHAENTSKDFAEYRYELEKSKEFYPEEWEAGRQIEEELRSFTTLGPLLFERQKQKEKSN